MSIKVWGFEFSNGLSTGSKSGRFDATELGDNPPFILSNSQPAGYVDVTSIQNWRGRGELGYDWRWERARIQGVMEEKGGWAGLDIEEKKVVAEYFLVDQTLQVQVLLPEALQEAGRAYHLNGIASRERRYFACELLMLSEIGQPNSLNMAEQILESDLADSYIRYGRESLERGTNKPALLDFINSTPGTPWEETGLSQQNFATLSMSIPQVVGAINNMILRGDFYDTGEEEE